MFRQFVLRLWIGLAATLSAASALASSGEEGHVSLNPISKDWIQQDLAIWTAVVFLLLLLILKKFAWKPLMEGIDERERQVADQIERAEDANRRAQELLAGYEAKLADAEGKVRGIIDQGRRDAERVGHELIEKAKNEAKDEQQRALQQIDAATNAAVQELADRSASLAVDLAGKIVHSTLKAADHGKLIEQAVAGFVRGKGETQDAGRN